MTSYENPPTFRGGPLDFWGGGWKFLSMQEFVSPLINRPDIVFPSKSGARYSLSSIVVQIRTLFVFIFQSDDSQSIVHNLKEVWILFSLFVFCTYFIRKFAVLNTKYCNTYSTVAPINSTWSSIRSHKVTNTCCNSVGRHLTASPIVITDKWSVWKSRLARATCSYSVRRSRNCSQEVMVAI